MIGKRLGHRKVQTTARYAHLACDWLKASAARIAEESPRRSGARDRTPVPRAMTAGRAVAAFILAVDSALALAGTAQAETWCGLTAAPEHPSTSRGAANPLIGRQAMNCPRKPSDSNSTWTSRWRQVSLRRVRQHLRRFLASPSTHRHAKNSPETARDPSVSGNCL